MKRECKMCPVEFEVLSIWSRKLFCSKKCLHKAHRIRRKATPDYLPKLRTSQTRYRIANAEKIKERQRRYWKSHPDKAAEKRKRYRAANLDKIREQESRRRIANREKTKKGHQLLGKDKEASAVIKRMCVECGKGIEAKTPWHVYCSAYCQRAKGRRAYNLEQSRRCCEDCGVSIDNLRRSDGRRTRSRYCFDCKKRRKNERLRDWHAANLRKRKEVKRIWRLNNLDKSRSYSRKHYKNNKEKVYQRTREYAKKNRAKINALYRKNRLANVEKYKERCRAHYHANKEQRATWMAMWRDRQRAAKAINQFARLKEFASAYRPQAAPDRDGPGRDSHGAEAARG